MNAKRENELKKAIEIVTEIINDEEEEFKSFHRSTIKQITPEIREEGSSLLNEMLDYLEFLIINIENIVKTVKTIAEHTIEDITDFFNFAGYRKAMQKFHPDMGGETWQAQLINELQGK